MSQRRDLPERLALFPLPGALLLPRARLPLHVFEPRYLALLDDVLKTPERMIGMIQPSNESGDRLHAIGCAGRITSFTETDDHRYMITLTGASRFRLGEVEEGFAPYMTTTPDWTPFARDLGNIEHDQAFNRDTFLDLLARFLDLAEMRTDWDSLKDAEDELLVNSLSMLLPFDTEDKQALLEAPSLTTRRETLVALMQFTLASQGGSSEDKMQ